MCARFTVLSDTPIPSAIAGCVIPISRHSTIWMRSRCAGGNFQCRAVFSRRTSALLHLIICPPNQMVGSESCRARKKYCANHTHPLVHKNLDSSGCGGGIRHRIVFVARREHADAPHAVALLRARPERPRRRAAEATEE